jgi:hypothetical protein
MKIKNHSNGVIEIIDNNVIINEMDDVLNILSTNNFISVGKNDIMRGKQKIKNPASSSTSNIRERKFPGLRYKDI